MTVLSRSGLRLNPLAVSSQGEIISEVRCNQIELCFISQGRVQTTCLLVPTRRGAPAARPQIWHRASSCSNLDYKFVVRRRFSRRVLALRESYLAAEISSGQRAELKDHRT